MSFFNLLNCLSFPRSSVGMNPAALQRGVTGRWSVHSGIPTLERGNDKNHLFRWAKKRAHPTIILFCFSFNLLAADAITLTPEQITNLGVEIGTLKPATSIPVLNAPAKVVIPPEHETIVSAPQASLISHLNVSVGDTVKKGQALATLNSPELVNLQHQYLQISNAKQLAFNNYQRDKKLFGEGIIPQKRWQETHSFYQDRESELNSIQQMLKISGMSESAINQLTTTHKLNSQTTLVAPISGVILERMATAGERLNALAPLYRLANLEQLWLEIAIPQEQINNVKVGDQVSIVNSAETATITLLGKSVNLTNQSIIARAVIAHNQDTIRAGQSVNIQLTQTNSKTAFEVPNAAIAQNEGKTYLFVRNAKGFAVLPVNVTGKQAKTSMISGALTGTEQIAVKGAVALKANWMGLGGSE
jgi:cobalt-zinc-cadmium efflux system membrane fusion protein